ncbi:glycosyltransferase family 4 protein [Barrientosiimonas endolithica]|uniref:glycosyltransferase family 4 protein n=1 Tax=Barrientosiimonas endolithica TaxID=1535208 RepID=UPI00259B2C27|nr:glycosyltransferase family 4 protein [Barrientosiimonas endolithica]
MEGLTRPHRISFAANHGQMAGGEVMLLAMAEAATELGHDVEVVAPEHPHDVVDEAARRGLRVVPLRTRGGADQLRVTRAWDRAERRGLLWCNGPRPALATTGRPHRVVHLHQRPSARQRRLVQLARRGALATIVPSSSMARHVASAKILWNWSPAFPPPRPQPDRGYITLGYLGRLSEDKGLLVLCEAVRRLQDRRPGSFRLLVAGESRFVAPDEAGRVAAALQAVGADLRGWMPADRFFESVDLAVFPSLWDEPFGLVVSEAMSARRAFVISDAGALPEVAGEGYPWTFRRGDADGLARLLDRASTADWAPTVEESYARWATHFSPEAGRERLGRLLGQLETRKAS